MSSSKYLHEPLRLESIWNTSEDPQYPISTTGHRNISLSWIYPSEKVKFYEDMKNGVKNLYSETDIEYKFNKWGFRCIDFDQISDDSLRVISLGCSNAEGVGLPENHTWPFILSNLISRLQNKNVANLNLGSGGSSNKMLAIRGIHAIETLKPDVIFVTWTYTMRTMYAYDNGLVENWLPLPVDQLTSTDEKTILKINYFDKIQNDFNDINELTMSFKLLNYACAANNIKICNNLILLMKNERKWIIDRTNKSSWICPNIKWVADARDILHPGHTYNKSMAINFYGWYIKNVY